MYRRQELRNYRTATEVVDDIDQSYNFPGVIRAPFPNNRGDLPIVSQGYSYTMDVMYLTLLGEERYGKKNGKYRIANRRTKGFNIRVLKDEEAHELNHYVPAYECALVIVETTSRKAWAYSCTPRTGSSALFQVLSRF